jgi:hypothetical protein
VVDRAAEGDGHGLVPVADPEDRDVGLEQGRVDLGRAGRIDAGRAAGQDHRSWATGQDLGDRHRRRHDLAVDVGLADPPRDELRVLRTEVDDQDNSTFGGHLA